MTSFLIDGDALEARYAHELLRIEPWGADSVRVRWGRGNISKLDVGALDEAPTNINQVEIEILGNGAQMINGELTVSVYQADETNGGTEQPLVRFSRTSTGEELLAEEREHIWWPGARVFYGNRAGSGEVHQQFRAYEGERLYGMGQRSHGRLDHKGLSLDLVQRNGEVSIPFVVSSRGYGFLWNQPAIGRVDFAENATRWTSTQAQGLDYFFTVGSPDQVLARYADATGHAPTFPKWASGFWQSKLRYRDQAELMEVAREYQRRELPLSVIVTDFFHWPAMGDFKFDSNEYPDPRGMIRELEDMDVKLMVSIWPTVSPLSENYERLRDGGMLIGTDQGTEFQGSIRDKGMAKPMPIAFYDPTNPDTREFVWSTIRKNYFDLGVRVWWLDSCEPDINPGHHSNLSMFAGPGAQVASIYPRDNARMFADGLASAALDTGHDADADTVLLCRSAWAGQQKYGAAVWSGDILATWDALQRQVRAGLSIAMAGIPWWTTDIGGFHGGDSLDESYRELMVRWFQYGAFCPLFRLHGYREPRPQTSWDATGGPNEVWSFGDEAYEHIVEVLHMRERIRPYLHAQMEKASSDGLPPMRPLLVDFPEDPVAWTIEDQMMFGPDLLVAPILELGSRSRSVYLPAGSRWTHVWSGRTYDGGQSIDEAAPLSEIPVYLRDEASIPVAG